MEWQQIVCLPEGIRKKIVYTFLNVKLPRYDVRKVNYCRLDGDL